MRENEERLTFTADKASLRSADVAIVAPDVPTDDEGNSDLSGLKNLLALADTNLGPAIPLIVLSQVPPGFSRSLALESGRPFYCQVETLIFGQAVERALNPERIIFGAAAPDAPIHPLTRLFSTGLIARCYPCGMKVRNLRKSRSIAVWFLPSVLQYIGGIVRKNWC